MLGVNGSLERWTYQILSLLAGLLPHSEIELAAYTIRYKICFEVMIFFLKLVKIWGIIPEMSWKCRGCKFWSSAWSCKTWAERDILHRIILSKWRRNCWQSWQPSDNETSWMNGVSCLSVCRCSHLPNFHQQPWACLQGTKQHQSPAFLFTHSLVATVKERLCISTHAIFFTVILNPFMEWCYKFKLLNKLEWQKNWCRNESLMYRFVLRIYLRKSVCSVRVSNELGAGRPHAAKFSVFMSIMMSMGVGIIMAAMVLLPQNVWGHAFSKEQEVLDRVSRVAPYLAAVTILNCIQVVLSGESWYQTPITKDIRIQRCKSTNLPIHRVQFSVSTTAISSHCYYRLLYRV